MREYQNLLRSASEQRPILWRGVSTHISQRRTAILTTRPQARLVSDELDRRSMRLLEHRRKQAKFRDLQKTLYNFDFSFNQKMNRSLVFDLVLLGGVWIHLPPTSGTTL